MPKLRRTERQDREAALRGVIYGQARKLGMEYDYSIAQAMQMSEQAFARRKADFFGRLSLEEAVQMNRALGITAQQCLEYMGYTGVLVLEAPKNMTA